jgi:predicted kinase
VRAGKDRWRSLPLFVVTGASGSGKSTLAHRLVGETDDVVVFDADVIWHPGYDTPADGYAAFRNLALRVAKHIGQSGRPVVLMTGGTPAQFEASPERRYFSAVHYLALTCEDSVLTQRLSSRPAWRKSSTPDVLERERSFNQWLRENGPTTDPPMMLVNTSEVPEADAARTIRTWITAVLS